MDRAQVIARAMDYMEQLSRGFIDDASQRFAISERKLPFSLPEINAWLQDKG